jgi:hypothetical protein
MGGEQLLGELGQGRARLRARRPLLLHRPAHLVVLDRSPVQPDARVGLVGDDLAQVLGRRADRLLEQRQQQLVLAVEVLVEAAKRLPGPFHHLLDGEFPTRGAVHQLLGGVEEALHAALGPFPGRPERPRHGMLTPARGHPGLRGTVRRVVRRHGREPT